VILWQDELQLSVFIFALIKMFALGTYAYHFFDEGPDADPAPGAKAIPAQKIRRLPAGGAKETRSLSPLRAMGMHRARTVTIPVARAWGGSVAARSVLDAHPANGESPSGAGGSIRFAFQPGGISGECAGKPSTQENPRRKPDEAESPRLPNGSVSGGTRANASEVGTHKVNNYIYLFSLPGFF